MFQVQVTIMFSVERAGLYDDGAMLLRGDCQLEADSCCASLQTFYLQLELKQDGYCTIFLRHPAGNVFDWKCGL